MYYFIRVFKINCSELCVGNREILYQDTIKCESKEEAKQYVYENYGKIPYRKTANLKEGDIYAYIADSTEYWYDYYHKEYLITCSKCGRKIKIVGEHDLRCHSNKYGQFCSFECKEIYSKEMMELEKENNPWITLDDHLCVPKDNDAKIVGYIYRITNKLSHKSYIGKTIKPPLFRWWQHLKMDNSKFDRVNITDLIFEVLEIVTYDKTLDCDKLYKNGDEKLSFREMFYIKHYQTDKDEYGFNKMIETSKIGNVYQLTLELEDD